MTNKTIVLAAVILTIVVSVAVGYFIPFIPLPFVRWPKSTVWHGI